MLARRQLSHAALVVLAVLLFLTTSQPASADVPCAGNTWTGGGDGSSWTDGDNWADGVPDQGTDTACIQQGSVTVDENHLIAQVVVADEATLTVPANKQLRAQVVSIQGEAVATAYGNLYFDDTLEVAADAVVEVRATGGDLSTGDAAASITGSGTIELHGGWFGYGAKTITVGSDIDIVQKGNIDVSGTVVLDGGSWEVDGTSAAPTQTSSQGNGLIQLLPNATIHRTAGAGVAAFNARIKNDGGTVQADTGTVQLNGGNDVASEAGTYVADGGTIHFNHVSRFNGAIFSGDVRASSQLHFSGSTLTLHDPLTLQGSAAFWSDVELAGDAPTVDLEGTRFVESSATVTVPGAGLIRQQSSITGGTGVVELGGEWRIEGDLSIAFGTLIHVIEGGLLARTAGGGTASIASAIDVDGGTVRVETGMLSLDAGDAADVRDMEPVFEASAGATIRFTTPQLVTDPVLHGPGEFLFSAWGWRPAGSTITLADDAVLRNTGGSFFTHGGASVAGAGTLELEANDPFDGGAVEIGPDIVVNQRVNVRLYNLVSPVDLDGTWNIVGDFNLTNYSSQELNVRDGGELRKTAGAGMSTRSGHIDVEAGGLVSADSGRLHLANNPAQQVGTTLGGGTYQATGGATLSWPGADVVTTLDATVSITGGASTISDGAISMRALTSITSNGMLEIGPGASHEIDGAGVLANAGQVNVRGTLGGVDGIASTSSIVGDGTIVGDVINGGELSLTPGGDRTLDIDGVFTQTAVGTTSIVVNGVGNADAVVVSGTASVAGTLDVDADSYASPVRNDQFTVIDAGGTITGIRNHSGLDLPGEWALLSELAAADTELRLRVEDAVAPQGGAVSWTSQTVPASTGATTISFTVATDQGAGVASHAIQQRAGTPGSGACAASGTWVQVGGVSPASPLVVGGFTAGTCYVWRLVTLDGADNAETVAGTGFVVASGDGGGGGGGGGGGTPTDPCANGACDPPPPTVTTCKTAQVTVQVLGRAAFGRKLCAGLAPFTQEKKPSFGSVTVAQRSYVAPSNRRGTTHFILRSADGTKSQRVNVTVVKQLVRLSRPAFTCQVQPRGLTKCTITQVVPRLAGGGKATLTIQRRVKVRNRFIWKGTGACAAASGRTTACTRSMTAGTYRVRASTPATNLRTARTTPFASRVVA